MYDICHRIVTYIIVTVIQSNNTEKNKESSRTNNIMQYGNNILAL